MKANEKTILRFLESSDTKFTVPIYQRPYSWSIEEAKKLFDDILKIIKCNYKSYFLGSIVSIYNDSGDDREYLIIDGQQRITSISLILLAIYKLLDKNILEESEIIKEKILNEYIINQYRNYDDRLKLVLKGEDFSSYKNLFSDLSTDELTKIDINYSYFYNRILKEKIKLSDIFEAIKKIYVVEIELKASNDNPQLIFEGLNSTGRNLTEVDKIRNLLFMNMKKDIQEKLYNIYFKEIEKLAKDNILEFMHNYLCIKESRVIGNENLYVSFKTYLDNKDIEIVLADIASYAKHYTLSKDVSFRPFINKIHLLTDNRANILLLQLFKDYTNSIISKEILIRILKVVISYLLRRVVCKIPSNSLYKFFINTIAEIEKSKKVQDEYLELFKFILLKQVDSLRFPRDIEFKRAFFENDLYRLENKRLIYILEELENYDNKEKVNIKELIKDGVLTIEHIIPQKLNSDWKSELGEEYEEVHSKYVHTIANLTLTAYNSNLSNKSFKQKCVMDKGFAQSRLKLNKFISLQKQFTEIELLKRALLLFDDAKNLWPIIKSKYKLSTKRKVLYYLSDDILVDDLKINGFIFEGVLREARSIKGIFDSVLNLLYDIEPLLLSTIIKNSLKLEFLSFKVSNDKSLVRNPYEIFIGVYSDKNLSDNVRIEILKNILNIYGIELDELSFYAEK